MSEPIDFLIVEDLRDALRGISQADGYHYDVRGTEVRLNPDHEMNALAEIPEGSAYPFVLIQVGAERWDYRSEHGTVRLILPVRIHWVGKFNPVVDVDDLRMFYRGCADVEKAICLDTGRGQLPNGGGSRATDTRITGRLKNDDREGSEVWAMVDTEIAQRRIYGQPNAG